MELDSTRAGNLKDFRLEKSLSKIVSIGPGVVSDRWSLSVCLLAFGMVFLVLFPNRFNVPGAISFFGWEIFPTDWVVTGAVLVAWVFGIRSVGSLSGEGLPDLVLPLVGWFLTSLVSILLSGDQGVPLGHKSATLVTVTLWTLPLFVIPRLNLTRKEIFTLIFLYAALGSAGGLLSCFQSLRIEEFSELVGWKYAYGVGDSERRADLPLGVSTVISYFFVSIVPIGFALLVCRSKIRVRATGLVVLLLVGGGTIFTASRAAYILLFLVALVCVFWMRYPGSSRMLPAAGLMVLVLLVGTALTELNFERITHLKDGSFGWRYRGLEAAVAMTAENPLIGLGMETHFRRQHGPVRGYFSTEKPHDAIYYKNRIAPSDSHNLYLLITAESGLIGLVFYLLFFGKLLLFFMRCQGRCKVAEDRLWIRVFAIGVGAMLLHSLFGTDPIRQTRLAPLFWIFCGLGLSLCREALSRTEDGNSRL